MHKLLPILRRDFPDFVVRHTFEVGLPVYFVRMQVEVLEPQELSSFEIYFLHALALAVNTREEIAELLGLSDRDLITPGASLLKREYISQGPPIAGKGRPIFLTEKGRAALGAQKAPPVPVRRSAQLHFNAMTWQPMPLEASTWSIEQMEKEGLCILPPSSKERPTLGDFTVKEVASVLQDIPPLQKKEVVDLIEIKKMTLEYVAPLAVMVLHHRATQEQRYVIYRNAMLQRTESSALQRLFERGRFHLPDDAIALVGEGLTVPKSLPSQVAQVTQQLTENEATLRTLQAELAAEELRRGTTQDRREREVLEEHIEHLQSELQTKRLESEQLQAQLQQNRGSFLRTEEHRAVLERALREAREEVIIISPWMNRRTCDDALCGLMTQAIKRGVRIRIGHGITERAGDLDAGRNRANAQRVIRALRACVAREALPEQTSLLDICRTSGTHQKILVCDRTFAVLGSFNWLSYRGEQDEGYRSETSVLLCDATSVAQLAQIALQEWPD